MSRQALLLGRARQYSSWPNGADKDLTTLKEHQTDARNKALGFGDIPHFDWGAGIPTSVSYFNFDLDVS